MTRFYSYVTIELGDERIIKKTMKLINPIKEKHLEMSYEEMAEKTKLHIQTIYALAKMTPEELKKVQIGTFLILKKKLNIDLAKNIKY